MHLNLIVLLGSVRSDRKGLRVARYVERQFTDRGHAVTLVDPQELQLPLLDRMYQEYPKGSAPEVLERLASLYRAADAFVVVSAEYNHSIPPALSNLLDHFLEEVLLAAVVDRLLFSRRVRRCAGRHAAPRHALRARYAEYSEPVSRSSRRADVQRDGRSVGCCHRPPVPAVCRRTRMVRRSTAGAARRRRSVLKRMSEPPEGHARSGRIALEAWCVTARDGLACPAWRWRAKAERRKHPRQRPLLPVTSRACAK